MSFYATFEKQVENFSHNVSANMIKNQHFTHITNLQPHTSTKDTSVRNYWKKSETR